VTITIRVMPPVFRIPRGDVHPKASTVVGVSLFWRWETMMIVSLGVLDLACSAGDDNHQGDASVRGPEAHF